MNQVDFRTLSDVYDCSASPDRELHVVSHQGFSTYSIELSRLMRSLGEYLEDDLWKDFLRPLKRYRFAVSGAPISLDNPILKLDLEAKRQKLVNIQQAYPRYVDKAALLIDILAQLLDCPDNPFFDVLVERCAQMSGQGALLLRDTRMVGPSEQVLATNKSTRGLPIVTSTQLCHEKCFETLFILGAVSWFPPFIFTAPRARRIELARYSCVRDSGANVRSFIAPVSSSPTSALRGAESDSTGAADSTLDATELLPIVDWNHINRRLVAGEIDSPLESIEARAAILEGDYLVFLEATEGSTILAIDLDSDETLERVARVPVREVKRGSYVVLRSGGGGDYIVGIADRLFLRSRADDVRKAQHEWKTRLRGLVTKLSLLEVSVQLLDLGSNCANELNLRNWMSARSIRTHDPVDFQAIMKLVGLGDEWKEYWAKMELIDRAHRRAGQYIRRQLLKRLEQSDLSELERHGRMEFKLPDADAGSLTAFRVLDVSPETRMVSISRIGYALQI